MSSDKLFLEFNIKLEKDGETVFGGNDVRVITRKGRQGQFFLNCGVESEGRKPLICKTEISYPNVGVAIPGSHFEHPSIGEIQVNSRNIFKIVHCTT